MHFLEWKCMNSAQVFTQFVSGAPMNGIPALVQIMAWHQTGDMPMMVSFLAHIYVTRPQWVKCAQNLLSLLSLTVINLESFALYRRWFTCFISCHKDVKILRLILLTKEHSFCCCNHWGLVTRHMAILVNTGSGNGLLLDSTTPSPEPKLTYHQ